MASAATVDVPTIRELLDVKPPSESIKWLNALFYANPGVGKTYLLGTAADHEETSPVLICDVEGGTTTLRHRQDVDIVQIRTMRQLQEVQNELVKQVDPYYKTVCIDSLTELQKLDMRTLMDKQFADKPDSTDPFVPSQREWGKSSERLRLIIRSFKDLPCHVLTTCLLAEKRNERTNVVTFYPSLPGKLAGEVSGFFDIVGLLLTDDVDDGKGGTALERRVQFAATQRVIAKDRTSSLGDVMKSPTIPDMIALINS